MLLAFLPVMAIQYNIPVVWRGDYDTNWCWASSCQMILGYYGFNWTEQAIGNLGTHGVDTGDVLFPKSNSTLPAVDYYAYSQIISKLSNGAKTRRRK
jgi:hypothetical protein